MNTNKTRCPYQENKDNKHNKNNNNNNSKDVDDYYKSLKSCTHLHTNKLIGVPAVAYSCRDKITEIIMNKYDEIVKMYNNREFDNIRNIFGELYNTNTYKVDIRQGCSSILLDYCLKQNDINLFRNIIQSNEEKNDHVYSIGLSLTRHTNPILFLRILFEYGITLHPRIIYFALIRDNTQFISYLIDVKHDITQGWLSYLKVLKKTSDSVKLFGIPMLKLLLNANINVLSNLYVLMRAAIIMHRLPMIEFIVEMHPNHDLNKYKYLNECCESHNKDALIYFLKNGANVHMINQNSVTETNIDIIAVLIDHNYILSKKTLKKLLIRNFKYNLNNTIYFVKIGAKIKWLFDDEEKRKYRPNPNNYAFQCYSILERVITENKIDHIKFLAENYLTLLKPELNRLFVIACANGRNDIVSYLYDLYAEDALQLNIKALFSAIFFGHYDTIIMLLKYGMDFNMVSVCTSSLISIKENNLFEIARTGYCSQNSHSEIYNDLVNNNTIFRNDNYNYGEASEYVNIIKLLISYQTPIGKCCIFNRHSVIFYSIDIFTYFLQNGMDINITWGHHSKNVNNFLTVAISAKKLDVIEFLLQNKINTKILKNHEINNTINNNEQIKNLLLKYGVKL